MPLTLTQLRAQQSSVCAYGLAIEGLPYIWVTDHPDDALLGSGAGSWIGRYEDAVGWETVGQRTVLRGLKISSLSGISRGQLNPKTGMLESTGHNFEIVDYDDVLTSIFATEGQEIGKLGERIAPSQTALDATLIVSGLTAGNPINPANYHVGIEHIGPSRERRHFYSLPIQGIGLHHQVHLNAAGDPVGASLSPPPVPVTASPHVFAGRLVTLWRFYRDGTIGTNYLAWPSWDSYAATDYEWIGVMRDAGEYKGDRTWTIQCYGPESLLRRTLGGGEHDDWLPIQSATISLDTDERGIAINYRFEQWGALSGVEEAGLDYQSTHHYNSGGFGACIAAPGLLPASGTVDDFITAINGAIQDVGAGTRGDFDSNGINYPGGSITNFFDDDHDAGDSEFNDCRLEGTPTKLIIRRNESVSSVAGAVSVVICMHEKVWRLLGFDPGLQDGGGSTNLSSRAQAYSFDAVGAGDVFFYASGSVDNTTSQEVPGDGYWSGWFTSARLNRPGDLYSGSVYGIDGDGGERTYEGVSQHTPIILTKATPQTITIGASFPYIATDPAIGTASDAARYFVFRGKRTVGDALEGAVLTDEDGTIVDELETEDEFQVAEVEWNHSGTNYGSVDDSAGAPTLTISDWMPPRKFGVDRPAFDGEWVGHASGKYALEMRPMVSWVYRNALGIERAWAVFAQILLSTGSGSYLTPGLNGATTDIETFFADDLSNSDWGLGIPHEIVQNPTDIRDAFASSAIDGDAHSALNQVRYLYAGSVESHDVIQDILRPRGLALSLSGGQFGVVPFTLPDPSDAAYALNENDLYGDIGNPAGIHATQTLRVSGPIDHTKLAVRMDPSKGSAADEMFVRSRDPGARTRRGDFEEQTTGHGLIPTGWKVGEWSGEPDGWEQDWLTLWGDTIPNFYAKRHFVWRATVSRIQGQFLRPGTIVTLSDRNVINPAGGYGITNAVGLVLKADLDDAEAHSYGVEILIFANQFDTVRTLAPIARIASGYTGGSSVTVSADNFGHGGTGDGLRFSEPSWSNVGGNLVVCVLEWDRTGWTLHSGDTQEVTATTATTVTLSGAFSTTFHARTHKWLVAAPYASQNANEWPRTVLYPICLADGTYAGGSAPIPDLLPF